MIESREWLAQSSQELILKEHVVLVPKDAIQLLDIFPLLPNVLTDIALIVCVGKTELDIFKIDTQLTVRKSALSLHFDGFRSIMRTTKLLRLTVVN